MVTDHDHHCLSHQEWKQEILLITIVIESTWGSDNHKDHDDYEDLGNAESKDGPDVGVGSQGGEDSKKTSQQHADWQLGFNQVSCNVTNLSPSTFLVP